jgi:hypothetical protein
MLQTVLAFLSSNLAYALYYAAGVVGVDVILGLVLAGVWRTFDLRRILDFVETTVGFQKTAIFLGTLALMFLRQDQLTEAVVSGLAAGLATSVLPDVYSKLSTLFFAGKLPMSETLTPRPVTK